MELVGSSNSSNTNQQKNASKSQPPHHPFLPFIWTFLQKKIKIPYILRVVTSLPPLLS
jgi:hypothetical protein